MRTAFLNLYCEVFEMISSDTLVGCRTVASSTDPSNRRRSRQFSPWRRVHLTLNMFRHDDGDELAGEWAQYANLEAMRQRGT